jgi:hypothetical protein
MVFKAMFKTLTCIIFVLAGAQVALFWYGTSYNKSGRIVSNTDDRLRETQASLDQLRDETALSGTLSARSL